MTKQELFTRLKIESVVLIIQDRFAESNLIIDILCYLDSCLYNNSVIFDYKLLERFKKYDVVLYNLLSGFIKENNIIIGE